jgi:alkyl hydroperoxide reductase subunit AhpF
MSLLSPADQQQLRESFAAMVNPVRLLFFTQSFDCETCLETKQILDELPPLSDKIILEEVNFVLEREKAAQYAIDRAPGIAVVSEARTDSSLAASPGAEPIDKINDSRIRFLGAPSGYEFMSLIQAVQLVGGARSSSLTAESQKRVAAVDRQVMIKVFTTPT